MFTFRNYFVMISRHNDNKATSPFFSILHTSWYSLVSKISLRIDQITKVSSWRPWSSHRTSRTSIEKVPSCDFGWVISADKERGGQGAWTTLRPWAHTSRPTFVWLPAGGKQGPRNVEPSLYIERSDHFSLFLGNSKPRQNALKHTQNITNPINLDLWFKSGVFQNLLVKQLFSGLTYIYRLY
jgi:hypothetical protein